MPVAHELRHSRTQTPNCTTASFVQYENWAMSLNVQYERRQQTTRAAIDFILTDRNLQMNWNSFVDAFLSVKIETFHKRNSKINFQTSRVQYFVELYKPDIWNIDRATNRPCTWAKRKLLDASKYLSKGHQSLPREVNKRLVEKMGYIFLLHHFVLEFELGVTLVNNEPNLPSRGVCSTQYRV